MSVKPSFFKKYIRVLANFLIDIKFGAFLGGNVKTPYSDMGAYDTVNTSYGILPLLFSDKITPADVLVDVGCGKGRVINWWLDQGNKNKIIGIELDSEIANKTAIRLSKYNNVEIISGNAVDMLPADGTLFYLYSPFNEEVMIRFSEKLKSLFMGKSNIRLIYYNPEHVKVFESDPDWKVKRLDVGSANIYHDPVMVELTGGGSDSKSPA